MRLALPLLLLAGCSGKPTDSAKEPAADTGWSEPDYAARVSITEGVWGAVLRRRGHGTPAAAPTAPLETAVRAWPVLQDAELERADDRPGVPGVYRTPAASVVAEARSDADGFYELALPAGQYSVLVQDLGDWFCDRPAAEGVCLVTVPGGEVVQNDIFVDY
jgi:hypothetical protein